MICLSYTSSIIAEGKFHLLESLVFLVFLEQLHTFSTSGLVFFGFFGTYDVKSMISLILFGTYGVKSMISLILLGPTM